MSDPTTPDLIRLHVDSWFPRPGWSQVVRPAYRVLAVPGVSWRDAVPAWVQLAMMLGDTRAAPLCALVCLHAHRSLPDGEHDGAVTAHLNLCLWDLGLAEPVERTDDSGVTRHVMRINHGALERWVDGVLRPFAWTLRRSLALALLPDRRVEQPGRGRCLARAALFALRLAALRTGVVTGPALPSLAEILDDSAWTETPT